MVKAFHTNPADAASSGGDGYHKPVMLNEVIEALNIRPNGTYVDCTFGGGGHSRAILQKLSSEGRLFAFDQDEDARQNIPEDPRLTFIPHNFRHLKRFLRLHEVGEVDGILADLGVSSHHFDEPTRGFSTRFDGPLDMRMDQRTGSTAAAIIANFDAAQLQSIFEKFGEVTNAKTLARTIVDARKAAPLETIAQFKQAVHQCVKGNPNKYFAQVFQALRMEVNEELDALESLLKQAEEMLAPGGRMVVLTFHSLEDRLVKNVFKSGSATPQSADLYGNKPPVAWKAVYRKPLTASEKELKENTRARSAKLRAAEKIN